MSEWLSTTLTRAQQKQDWLAPIRARALKQLANTQWPNRRTEAWRYTSLHALQNKETVLATGTSPKTVEAPQIEGLNSIDLVFIDGQFVQGGLSNTLPAGLKVKLFSQLSEAEQEQAIKLFNQAKPAHHIFGLVNDALLSDGVLIEVAERAYIEQPIRIINYSSEGLESHHRILVHLGKQAKATVIEHGAGIEASVNTAFAEYVLEEKAQLEHYRFGFYGEQAIHIGGSHFKLGEASQLNSTIVSYGSLLHRLDTDVVHRAQHAHAKMNCIYLLAPKEHFDLHSNIEHAKPNGTTEQNARGIMGDRSRAVFSGKIHIHPHAQKTLAELHNRNLLLSRGAQISTTPALEIYADDVQCAHGATVAEISEDDLYYLQTRGISKQKALVMLNFGFIQELVDEMPNKALAEWLTPILRNRFQVMEPQ